MVILFWIAIAIVPFLVGSIRFPVKIDLVDSYISGILFLILFFGGVHLFGLFFGIPVSKLGVIFLLIVFAVVVHSVWCKVIIENRTDIGFVKEEKGAQLFLVFLVLLIVQVLFMYMKKETTPAGDITLETVRTFLYTNQIYSVHPLTGAEFSGGMSVRYKILCLPTIYAIICNRFAIEPDVLIYNIIPILVLVTSYAVYWKLSGLFFTNNKERFFFLIIVLGIYLLTDRGVSVGYQGTAIRDLILLPYTLYLGLSKKWIAIILCILVEAVVVWTLYGFGLCLIVGGGMLLWNYLKKPTWA